MKKTSNVKFLSSLLLVLLSCSDSFLDTRPYGVEVFKTLSETRNGAESLLIGAYSLLDGVPSCNTCFGVEGAASNWVFGSIVGGDAYKGTEEGDLPEINEIEINNTSDVNPFPLGKWVSCYNGIQRANDAIRAFQGLKDIEIPDPDRKKRIAEARFLRAYYHYDLYRIFHNVPYIDETVEDTRISNLDNILPKIQDDFTFAAANLPPSHPELGRITKGAAQSYLAITWMWAKQFNNAKMMFDLVTSTGGYALNNTYHENFNADFRKSKESILEVQQSVNDGALGINGNYGDVLNYPFGTGPVGCCGFHQPSQNLVNAFKTDVNGLPLLDNYNDPGTDVTNDQGLASSDPSFTPYSGNLDPRLDWTVGRRGIPYLDWGKHKGKAWIRKQAYGGPYSPIKNMYHLSQQGQVAEQGAWSKGFNSNNLKLLRYADVLLYAAEAEIELGNLEAARGYVNLIRARAKKPSGFVMDGAVPAANYVIDTYNISWTDQNYARKAVRFERRLELGMEGHRFFDLVRWGIAAQEKNAYFAEESKKRYYLVNAIFEAGKDEYQPIPLKAIQLSNKDGKPTLQQNSGY